MKPVMFQNLKRKLRLGRRFGLGLGGGTPSVPGKVLALSGLALPALTLLLMAQEEPAAVPHPLPADRYAALLEKSPFAVSTAAPEPAAPTESFAANWKVNGISKSRAVDGTITYTVFIQSRDLTTRFVLSGDLPNGDGISIASVEEGKLPTQTVVMLRKGSETAKVEFDQATVSASVAAPAGGPGVPPNASRPPGASAPTGAPKVPAARPSAIPRPGNSPGAIPRPSTVPGAAPNPAGSATPGRRVRTVEEPR